MPKQTSSAADTAPAAPDQAAGAPRSPEYVQAKRRVMMYKAFFLHAAVYAVVNILLLLIDLATGPGLWFYWALFGWGIGLAAHAGVVWGAPHLRAWEQTAIAREMQRNAH